MNKNIILAKKLVTLAKQLVAADGNSKTLIVEFPDVVLDGVSKEHLNEVLPELEQGMTDFAKALSLTPVHKPKDTGILAVEALGPTVRLHDESTPVLSDIAFKITYDPQNPQAYVNKGNNYIFDQLQDFVYMKKRENKTMDDGILFTFWTDLYDALSHKTVEYIF